MFSDAAGRVETVSAGKGQAQAHRHSGLGRRPGAAPPPTHAPISSMRTLVALAAGCIRRDSSMSS